MRRVIKSDTGHALYSQRKHAIEPIFGQIKHNRRIARFQRRGITACRSEWRLIATTHNILKLWRASSAPAGHLNDARTLHAPRAQPNRHAVTPASPARKENPAGAPHVYATASVEPISPPLPTELCPRISAVVGGFGPLTGASGLYPRRSPSSRSRPLTPSTRDAYDR
jgi:hypothetical protein